MSYLSGGTLLGPLRFTGRATPGLSPAGQGRIYFDQATNKFVASENGGAYVDLVAATETLAETLAAGNTTGSTDIVVSTGQRIVGAVELSMRGGAGGGLSLGANATDYWSIDSSGNSSFTTEALGSINLTGGESGLNLSTAAVADGSAGGLYFQGGHVTNGTPSNAYAGWVDIGAGSCTGGTGEGGWVSFYAGEGRNAQGGFMGIYGGSCAAGNGAGGYAELVAGYGGFTGGTGGYLLLRAGSARGGTSNGGDVTIEAGDSVGGTPGVVNIGTQTASAITIGDSGNPAQDVTIYNTSTISGGATSIQFDYAPPSYPAGMWVLHPVGEAIYLGAGTIMVEADGVNNRLRGKYAVASNNAGENLTVSGGYGNGTGAGGALTLDGGEGGATGNGGAVTLISGAGGATSGNSGSVSVDAGAVVSGTAGTISVGTTNATALTIGRSGVTTTVNGTLSTASLAANGSVVLGAVASVSTNTTLNATNAIVLVDATSGAITITLPTAASANGRHYTIKKIDSSSNAVTVDGDGAETIDGATTVSLAAQYDAVEVVSNGTAWFIV